MGLNYSKKKLGKPPNEKGSEMLWWPAWKVVECPSLEDESKLIPLWGKGKISEGPFPVLVSLDFTFSIKTSLFLKQKNIFLGSESP